jgi:hypothetical protein
MRYLLVVAALLVVATTARADDLCIGLPLDKATPLLATAPFIKGVEPIRTFESPCAKGRECLIQVWELFHKELGGEIRVFYGRIHQGSGQWRMLTILIKASLKGEPWLSKDIDLPLKRCDDKYFLED